MLKSEIKSFCDDVAAAVRGGEIAHSPGKVLIFSFIKNSKILRSPTAHTHNHSHNLIIKNIHQTRFTPCFMMFL
jgi:hypothetical protein